MNQYGTFEEKLEGMSNTELLSFKGTMDLCERMLLDFVLWSRGLKN